MQKITTEQLQSDLQEIDKRLLIVPNTNRPGAANIFLNGVDICPWVPQFEVQSEHSSDYSYNLNDMKIPFKTIDEIKEIIKLTLAKTEDKEYSDLLFGADEKIEEETYGEHKA